MRQRDVKKKKTILSEFTICTNWELNPQLGLKLNRHIKI